MIRNTRCIRIRVWNFIQQSKPYPLGCKNSSIFLWFRKGTYLLLPVYSTSSLGSTPPELLNVSLHLRRLSSILVRIWLCQVFINVIKLSRTELFVFALGTSWVEFTGWNSWEIQWFVCMYIFHFLWYTLSIFINTKYMMFYDIYRF